MLDIPLISKTEKFLLDKLNSGSYLSSDPKAKAYRIEHSYRVANIGKVIAENEGFDTTEMIIACLLHDVSYCEKFGEDGWKNHGRRSAAIARPFLTGLGFAEDRVNDICYGIAIHVDDEADFQGERTPFALSVGDADNIDRFDVYRIHETLVYDGFLDMSSAEKAEYTAARLEKLGKLTDMPLATDTAREMWSSRIAFYIEFFGKLCDQIKNGKAVKQ